MMYPSASVWSWSRTRVVAGSWPVAKGGRCQKVLFKIREGLGRDRGEREKRVIFSWFKERKGEREKAKGERKRTDGVEETVDGEVRFGA